MKQEDIDNLLEEKFKQFKEGLKQVCDQTLDEIYSEYLPHVASDTECNVITQAEYALKDILQGRFTVDGDYLRVGKLSIYLEGSHAQVAQGIYNGAPDKIENATIKELQYKIESLNQQLESAYRNRY